MTHIHTRLCDCNRRAVSGLVTDYVVCVYICLHITHMPTPLSCRSGCIPTYICTYIHAHAYLYYSQTHLLLVSHPQLNEAANDGGVLVF